MDQTVHSIYFLYLKYDMFSCLASLSNIIGDTVDVNTDMSKLGDHAISMAVVDTIQNREMNSFAVSDLYELRKGLKGFINDYGS